MERRGRQALPMSFTGAASTPPPPASRGVSSQELRAAPFSRELPSANKSSRLVQRHLRGYPHPRCGPKPVNDGQGTDVSAQPPWVQVGQLCVPTALELPVGSGGGQTPAEAHPPLPYTVPESSLILEIPSLVLLLETWTSCGSRRENFRTAGFGSLNSSLQTSRLTTF